MTQPEDEVSSFGTISTVFPLEKVTAVVAVGETDTSSDDSSTNEHQAPSSMNHEAINRVSAPSKLKPHAANASFLVSMSLAHGLGGDLTSGYSVLLPSLDGFSDAKAPRVWLANSLTIICASRTLPISRIAGIHLDHTVFLAGASMVLAWSIVGAVASSPAVGILCRAMQGMGIAVLQPAVFSLISIRCSPGTQRNIALGICCASAPLSFCSSIAASGLAATYATWTVYFFIPVGTSLLSMVLVHASTLDHTRAEASRSSRLLAEWTGALAMLVGLISVTYALAAASHIQNRWQMLHFAVPLSLGVLSQLLAAFVEARATVRSWLPAGVFAPKSLLTFCFAALFFYATFGVFLCYSPLQFTHASASEVVLWHIPFAAGGCVLACLGGLVFHAVPITCCLRLSGAAWMLAPLLFAIASPTAPCWHFVFPSMVCATFGTSVTHTTLTAFSLEVRSTHYDGLAGTMYSVLLYVGMGFSVGVTEVVRTVMAAGGSSELDSYRAASVYTAASAAIGFVICVVGVRMPKVNGLLVDRWT